MEMERRMETVMRPQDERGFSLIEVLAAVTILAVGLLPLAALFAAGVQQMSASTPMMLAREKAREAIESVHAARDTGQASWANIQNEANGGVFDDNAVAIKDPGPDGLVNTDDDGADLFPASQYTREIDILPVLLDPPQPAIPNVNLREIRVIVRYRVNQAWRTYTLVSYITPFS
jgi:prepilin-type N-terminal cleavage/methylation domain-containing protein